MYKPLIQPSSNYSRLRNMRAGYVLYRALGIVGWVSGTVWWVIFVGSNFHGKSKKALLIKFRILNFVTATSPWVRHCCTSDDVIDTRAHDLL